MQPNGNAIDTSDSEELREQIWDWIYNNGPKPVAAVSEQFQVTVPTVISLLDHSWFAIDEDVVSIATVDNH
jgi:hypothetical protein